MIEGVIIKHVIKHTDNRGFFAELIKYPEPIFRELKQVSYSETAPGIIKAFHYHLHQDDYWFVTSGKALVCLHDSRKGSTTSGKTHSFILTEDAPTVVFIPRGVAHGYKVLGKTPLRIIYMMTNSYDPKKPDEHRVPHDDPSINFDWNTDGGI